MSQKTHVMHGRDHLLDGADPIRGLITNSGFTPYRECTIAKPDLVYYWPMDEASGDIADLVAGVTASRVTDTGTVTYGLDGPFDADYPARTSIGFAGTFGPTGADDRFETSLASSLFNGTNSWTLESWIYPTSVSASFSQFVFGNHDPLAVGQPGLSVATATSGKLDVARMSTSVTSSAVLPLNTWTHWRATYDGTTLRLYINGVLDGSAATSTTFAGGSSHWTIGNTESAPSSARPWQGRISDVAVYDAAVDTFCPTVTTEGPGSSAAPDGQVLTADGVGGIDWAYPTIEIEYA